MIFENRGKKELDTYRKIQNEVKNFIRTQKGKNSNDPISIIKSEDGKLYAVHTQLHYIGELRSLIGKNGYEIFLKSENSSDKNEITEALNEMLFEFMKSTSTAKDPAEDELKKKRKTRK